MDDFEDRQRRLDRARWLVRTELAIATGIPLVAGFLFVTGPAPMGPMSERGPTVIESVSPWVGIALYIVGLVWIIRLSRTNADAGESSWRYRDRQRRLDRARSLIRAELAIAIGIPLVAAFWFVTAPQTFGSFGSHEPTLVEWVIAVVGVALYTIGFVWMIRLSRANPEAGESSWRYRDF